MKTLCVLIYIDVFVAAACWAPQSRSVDISCRAGKEQRVMHAPPCVHGLVWGRRGHYIGGRVRLQRSKEHHGRAIGTREKRSAEKEEGGRRSPRYKEWKIAVRGICVSGSSRRGKFKECTTLRGTFECTSPQFSGGMGESLFVGIVWRMAAVSILHKKGVFVVRWCYLFAGNTSTLSQKR